MPSLRDKIRSAARRGKVVFSLHADDRIRERSVVRWQVVEGLAKGEIIESYPGATPNPKILVRQTLADGSEIIAVWRFVDSLKCAKLVTIYFEETR